LAKQRPWYADGLRFECQRCSACCRGEPGYVWVTETEIRQMAEAMGLLPDEFMRAYVRTVDGRLSLKELPGGDCVLWRGMDQGCLVYATRPTQCVTFPFWSEHLRSKAAWQRLAKRCPGINKGRLYTLREIRARLKRRD